MEKTRTLYRLRKYKISITIASLGLLFGIMLYTGSNIFHNQIVSYFRDQSTQVLQQEYQANINNAIQATDKSVSLLEKSSYSAIVFSLEVFLMVFVLLRLSGKTPGIIKAAPVMLGFGLILLSLYFLIIGLLLPANGQFDGLQSEYHLLKILGSILILSGNLIFIYQVFIQVVLEKVEN